MCIHCVKWGEDNKEESCNGWLCVCVCVCECEFEGVCANMREKV